VIERDERWLRLKRKAKKTPQDEGYVLLRKQRSAEAETVFGQLKGNQAFSVTGKVSTEWEMLALRVQYETSGQWQLISFTRVIANNPRCRDP
jgi:hypothetical protein